MTIACLASEYAHPPLKINTAVKDRKIKGTVCESGNSRGEKQSRRVPIASIPPVYVLVPNMHRVAFHL